MRRHAVGDDLLLRQVDALDGALVEGDVRVAMQQLADRVADLGRAELVGGDLVEQRLKRVVVVLVDDREADRGVAQFLRAPMPPKPAPRITTWGGFCVVEGIDFARRERRG